jgi:hypothetical protein
MRDSRRAILLVIASSIMLKMPIILSLPHELTIDKFHYCFLFCYSLSTLHLFERACPQLTSTEYAPRNALHRWV